MSTAVQPTKLPITPAPSKAVSKSEANAEEEFDAMLEDATAESQPVKKTESQKTSAADQEPSAEKPDDTAESAETQETSQPVVEQASVAVEQLPVATVNVATAEVKVVATALPEEAVETEFPVEAKATHEAEKSSSEEIVDLDNKGRRGIPERLLRAREAILSQGSPQAITSEGETKKDSLFIKELGFSGTSYAQQRWMQQLVQSSQTVSEGMVSSDQGTNAPAKADFSLQTALSQLDVQLKDPKTVHVMLPKVEIRQLPEIVSYAVKQSQNALPKRLEIPLQSPEGAVVRLYLQESQGQVRAQFSANDRQALEWLNKEVPQLRNLQMDANVRWLPPQYEAPDEQGQWNLSQQQKEQENKKFNGSMTEATEEFNALFDMHDASTHPQEVSV